MILGDVECDAEIGYFLRYGKIKPYEKHNCFYGLTEDDNDYHLHENEPDSYTCWQGTQIPKWLQ